MIATDIPGHRVAGWMPSALRLSAADPDRIAALAQQALGHTEAERSAEAVEAHRWVESNRDLEAWARQLAGLYEEAVAAVTAARCAGTPRRPRVGVRAASSGS